MVYGEVIRTSEARIPAVSNGTQNTISGEGEHRIIKRTPPEEAQLDNSGGRVTGVGHGGDELFSKIFC